MIGFQVEPMQSLLDPDETVPKAFFKDQAIEQAKHSTFLGVPEKDLKIDLDPPDGSDILITKRVDPENALGYRVYKGESDYFNKLQQELSVPSLEEMLRG